MNDYLDNKINHIHQTFPVHDDSWRKDGDTDVDTMREFMRALAALDVQCRGGQKKQIDVIKPPVQQQQTKPSIYGTSPRRVK